MNKKKINQLAIISFEKNKINTETVEKITGKLNNKDFREYIKALKRVIAKTNVYVESATELSSQDKKSFEELFKNKSLVFRVNPELILGVRIIEDDMVYNLNIENSIIQIKDYLDKSL